MREPANLEIVPVGKELGDALSVPSLDHEVDFAPQLSRPTRKGGQGSRAEDDDGRERDRSRGVHGAVHGAYIDSKLVDHPLQVHVLKQQRRYVRHRRHGPQVRLVQPAHVGVLHLWVVRGIDSRSGHSGVETVALCATASASLPPLPPAAHAPGRPRTLTATFSPSRV